MNENNKGFIVLEKKLRILHELQERYSDPYAALIVAKAIQFMNDREHLRDEYKHETKAGREYYLMADIRIVANTIIGKLSDDGNTLSAQVVGNIIRHGLQLEVGKRQGTGMPVYYDKEQIENILASIDRFR